MRKIILNFILVCLFAFAGSAQSPEQPKQPSNVKTIYYNGEITIKKPGSTQAKPLGLYVKLAYSSYFKNYTIGYIDSRGQQKKIFFEYEGPGKNESQTLVSLNGKKYIADLKLLDSSTGSILFIPEKTDSDTTFEIFKLTKSKKQIE